MDIKFEQFPNDIVNHFTKEKKEKYSEVIIENKQQFNPYVFNGGTVLGTIFF